MASAPTPLDTSPAFRRRARYVVVLVTATAVALYVLWITRQAFLLVFLGATVGVLFYHSSRWLADKTGATRGAMLALVVLVVLAGIGAAVYFGGPRVAAEAQTLIGDAPELIESAQARLGIPADALRLPSGVNDVSGRLLGVFSTLTGVFAGVLVVLLVAIYSAIDPGRYTRGVIRLADHRYQPFVRNMLERMGEVLLGWMKGVGIAVVALGTLAAVGLSVIGLPGALALAAFAAALTIIPNFGPFIGWLPAVIVGFSQGTTTGLWTLGLAVVAQQIEGSFITPKVQGEMVQVGPAFIIAGQIVFGTLAGFLGVLLVVPILGVGKVLLQELYIGPFVEGEPPDPDDRDHPVPGVEEGATARVDGAAGPVPAGGLARG
jgi:predicted PurR-regulated permease PerM